MNALLALFGVALLCLATQAPAQTTAPAPSTPSAPAQSLRLPSVLSDGAVFQQQKPIAVWGLAAPGRRIEVMLHTDGATLAKAGCTASAEGKWMTHLPPQEASFKAYQLEVSDGTTTTTLHNILIGEVWVAAGQSNMHLPVQYIVGRDELLKSANNPHLRSFGQEYLSLEYSPLPQFENRGGKWCLADSAEHLTARDTSGIGYTFALALFNALNRDGKQVPVAIVNAATGSTSIHAWISKDGLMASPRTANRYPQQWEPNKPNASLNQATAQFNHKVAPLTPLAVRGLLWMQGENDVNAGGEYYSEALTALIADWRRQFAAPEAPFIAAQLHPYGYNKDGAVLARFREGQIEGASAAGNAIALPVHDLPLTWNEGPFKYKHAIHPLDKKPVGERMALAARAMAYGEKLEYSGPQFAGMEKADGKLTIHLTHAAGLTSADGQPLREFALCGPDRIFHPAVARIVGETVELTSPEVTDPVAATYAFSAFNQKANLVNRAGQPAFPFRTDKVQSVYYLEP